MEGAPMESTVTVRFSKQMTAAVDKYTDPEVGYTRSVFIREAVKERLNKMTANEAIV